MHAYEIHAAKWTDCVYVAIPGSWSRTSGATLRSRGQTWQRISSVSSPPSLIAILLKAATSTGLTLRACVMSATFLFRLVSQSETQRSPCLTSVCLLTYLLWHMLNSQTDPVTRKRPSSWHWKQLGYCCGWNAPNIWLPRRKITKVNFIVTVIHRWRGSSWTLHFLRFLTCPC